MAPRAAKRPARATIACGLALALAACGGAAAPALRVQVPPEAPAAGLPEPKPPDAPKSRVAPSLEIKLDAVRQLIEAALPVRQDQPWMLVTREGASPRIYIRVAVERDAVALRFEHGRLRTEVPLRYWAAVNGAVKSPLPWQRDKWFDLAPDQSWGTRKEPQRATLVVNTEVQLDAQGQLHVQSAIEPIDPGAAPAGSFCVEAGIRICVDKSSFEGEVRGAFKQRVEPALQDAVVQVDRRLEAEANLRARLGQAWAQLQCPFAADRAALRCNPAPSEQGTWLQWRAKRLAAGPLGQSGKLLQVVVALEGRLATTRGSPPAEAAAPLPDITLDAQKAGFELNAPVTLGYDLITSQIAAALPAKPVPFGAGGEVRVTRAQIVGAAPRGGERLLLELHLEGAVDATVYATATLRVADLELGFDALAYTAQTQRLFAAALPELDHAAFLLALQDTLRVPLAPLGDMVTQLGSAALAGDPRISPTARITAVELSQVQLGDRALAALLTLRGRLNVRIRP